MRRFESPLSLENHWRHTQRSQSRLDSLTHLQAVQHCILLIVSHLKSAAATASSVSRESFEAFMDLHTSNI